VKVSSWHCGDPSWLFRSYLDDDEELAATLVEAEGSGWRWHAWDPSGTLHETGHVPTDRTAGALGGRIAAVLAADEGLVRIRAALRSAAQRCESRST
jgi:hypothetical protein